MPDPENTPQKVGQDAIWAHFQNAGVESFAGARPRLARLLSLAPQGAVLNIGLGDASFEALAVQKGLDVFCLDPCAEAIESVRQHLGLGDKAQVGRIEALPFPDARFDAVVASEVLEHLDDATLAQALAEVSRVLRPGGLFLGTVPRAEALAGQFTVCPCCGHGFHRWGHQQSFDEPRLAWLLAGRFMEIRVQAALFVAWERLNWAGKIASALKLLCLRLGRHGSGESLLFVATKAAP